MSAFSAAISGITDIKCALIRAALPIYEVHSKASACTYGRSVPTRRDAVAVIFFEPYDEQIGARP
jgi:hypothetical protein